MISDSNQWLEGKKVLLLSISMYILLFAGTLDWYRFYFDVDGVAYMTLARRVSEGAYFQSVNNLWSPLNNWIAAPFSAVIDDYILIFKVINAIVSIGILGMTYVIARRYLVNNALICLILLSLPLILLSYTHIQLAGDLLQLLLFLVYFYLITRAGFFSSVQFNVFAAVVMFFAYLAKSFSLPFFLIQYPGIYVLNAILYKDKPKLVEWLKPMVSGLGVFIVLALCWAYCLYLKYDQLMFSAAGALNYNWLMGRENAVMTGTQLLIPPPYADSPGFWEDPYQYYDTFIGPFDSLTTLARTGKLILSNIKRALVSLLDISFLSYSLLLFLLLFLYIKKIKGGYFNVIALVWTSMVVMAGYLLIHVETRYYWPVAVLLLISGGYLLENYLFPLIRYRGLKAAIALFFALSFIYSPLYDLKELKDSGKDLYAASAFMRANGVKGRFAGNYTGGGLNSWYLKVAYLSGSNLYTLRKVNFSQEEILHAIRVSQLDFFIYSFDTEIEKQLFLKGELAASASRVLQLPSTSKLILTFNETE